MDIVFRGDYDLIVVGGGISGICCAISAARKGLKCLLIEREGCLGGTATVCGVMQLHGGRRFDPKTDKVVRTVGGIFDEITDDLIKRGYAIDPDQMDVHNYNPYGWYPRMAGGIPCDVDALKLILEEKCLDAGVTIRLYTTMVEVRCSGHKLNSVITHDKGGYSEFCAKLFADCTGDADVAYMSGCPTYKGRENDGGMCPASTIFYVENVDVHKYVSYQNEHQSPKLVEIIERLKSEGRWPYKFEIFIAIETTNPGCMMINTLRQIDVDGTDAESMTIAGIEGRKMVYDLFAIMKEYFPGFESAHVSRIFDHIGIRESRRIDAREMITLENAKQGVHYSNTIAGTTYNFDLPDPKNPSFDPMMGDVKRPNATREHVLIEIPYGALLPKGIDNIIVAGRCLGAEREVMGACRVMGPCAAMGQAAGTAAAQAVKTGNYGDICIGTLQHQLKNDGIICLGD